MNKHIIIFIITICSLQISAQSLQDLSFGTDTTFEAMTWNIELFPLDGQTTVDYVSEIILALDVDVIAIQEIDEVSYFIEMVDNLEGWERVYNPNDNSGLGFIYNSNRVVMTDVYEIYKYKSRQFPRPPMLMKIKYKNERFVLINNHLKCCGDGYLDHSDPWDEEKRRYDACELLDDYIKYYLSDENVILLGDLNDKLTDNNSNNVFPFFLNKPSEYLFADMDIAQGSSTNFSYPDSYWLSHLDHILVSNELHDEYRSESTVVETIRIDDYLVGGLQEYFDYISDHRPVAIKFEPKWYVGLPEANNSPYLFINYPNPFKKKTLISFANIPENTQIEIYTLNGVLVQTFSIPENQSSVIWNTQNLSSGIYIAKLIIDNKMADIRKMALMS